MVVTVQYVLLHPSLEEALQCDLQRKEKQSSGWKENTHRGERQTDRHKYRGKQGGGRIDDYFGDCGRDRTGGEFDLKK